MRTKTKNLFKIIALAMAGIVAVTAIFFVVKAIVNYTKDDLKTISPSFEVGSLGSDGKYVDDESTLYTKEAFGCSGLQIKPDFDSTVNYQIYYYDILDNYISSTEVLSEGYSGEAPLNGAYARMVVIPQNDEDGKISWTEKMSYPKYLTIKVKKEQNINKRFIIFQGKAMERVDSVSDMVFTGADAFNATTFEWYNFHSIAVTSSTFLSVKGGETISFDPSGIGANSKDVKTFTIIQFSDLPSVDSFIASMGTAVGSTFTLDKKTKYIIISVYKLDTSTDWDSSELSKLSLCFTITK